MARSYDGKTLSIPAGHKRHSLLRSKNRQFLHDVSYNSLISTPHSFHYISAYGYFISVLRYVYPPRVNTI